VASQSTVLPVQRPPRTLKERVERPETAIDGRAEHDAPGSRDGAADECGLSAVTNQRKR